MPAGACWHNGAVRALGLALTTAAMLAGASQAAAAPGGVAYVKDGQVWVANLDGSKKVQLSEGDPWWNAVAISTSGGIAATKNEPNKVAQLSQFAIWNPDGTVKDQGPASPGSNFSGSLAAPLGLELTPSNSGLVFGFSNYVYGYPVGTLTTGYAILPSATRVTPTSVYTNTALEWPSLVGGNRVIGGGGGQSIFVESAPGNLTGPFVPWSALDVGSGFEYHVVTASDDGVIVGAELCDKATSPCQDKVGFFKTSGLLGAYVDDCFAPISGQTDGVDVSADGATVVWADADGVKVAPAPNLRPSGPSTCEFSSQPVTIEPGARYPALGPVDVDALYAARNPQPPAGGATTTTTTTTTPGGGGATTPTPALKVPVPGAAPVAAVPAGLAAGTLGSSGTTIQVAVGKAGKVTVTVTVPARSVGRKGAPVVIAAGTATAKSAGQLAVKLKPTKLGKKLKSKLRRKRVKIVIKSGGKATTKTITLR